jgi:hypothetical protein
MEELEQDYDLIIVGAGPAGIFTALELVEENSGLDVLILEKGEDIDERGCPAKEKDISCISCKNCSIVCGWGGAGAFSDGKLTLSPEIGGNLVNYIGQDKLEDLITYVDNVYLNFDAPQKVYSASLETLDEIHHKAIQAGLDFVPSKIRHLGTGHSKKVLAKMKEYLVAKGVTVKTGAKVTQIIANDSDEVEGIKLKTGEEIFSQIVVVAPGRENSEWLSKEAEKLDIDMKINPVDIGVRVEVPAPVLDALTDAIYESKFIYRTPTFDDKVRTFCMCPEGEVVTENNNGLITVNGHSHAEKKTKNTI